MEENHTNRAQWIEAGYRHFSLFGPDHLKLKDIAHGAGVSRTSFYQFFADHDDFFEALLDHHRQVARIGHERFRACLTYTQVFEVMVDMPEGVLFHRQLLLHKANPTYFQLYNQLNALGNEIIYPLWAKYYEFDGNELAGKKLHLMLIDLFYLNISEANLNMDALLANTNEIRRQLRVFAATGKLVG